MRSTTKSKRRSKRRSHSRSRSRNPKRGRYGTDQEIAEDAMDTYRQGHADVRLEHLFSDEVDRLRRVSDGAKAPGAWGARGRKFNCKAAAVAITAGSRGFRTRLVIGGCTPPRSAPLAIPGALLTSVSDLQLGDPEPLVV